MHMNHAPLFIRAWSERQRSSFLVVSFVAFAALFLFTLLRAHPVQAATCTFMSNGTSDFNTAANWSCARVPQGGDDVVVYAATTTNLSGNVSFSTLTASGTINVLGNTLNVTSTATIWVLGTVTSTNGTIALSSISGNASSSGALGSSTGSITVGSSTAALGSFQNNGIFSVGSGSATTSGNFTIGKLGNLKLNSGTFTVLSNFSATSGALFASAAGTFRVAGGGDQSIQAVTFGNNFVSNKTAGTVTFTSADFEIDGNLETHGGGTLLSTSNLFSIYGIATIGAGTTVTSTSGELSFGDSLDIYGSVGTISGNIGIDTTLTIESGGKLQTDSGQITAQGTFTNAGLITLGAGATILHTAESTKITDSSGTEASSISTNGTLYVTVQDQNRNMDGTAVETMSVNLTTNSAAGSDSETVTLTETGAATGIFRNSTAINVVNSGSVSTGNGQIEISASGVGTMNYTDNQDSSDTGSDTATLTYVSAAATASTGGGGAVGGGGSIPIAVTFQTSVQNGQTQNNQGNLANLTSIGVPVQSLVKLPDDGNPATQMDSAVYYIGTDGKRHAFPNNKVYGSWYPNFDGVQVVNQSQLASIPLGSNVTYKPADRMVKFTTDPKTYAVGKGGVLRWVKTESAAVSLYGSTWNTKIDDINDAFYTNYTFGPDVTGLADFNPATVESSVTYPSDSLVM